MFQTIDDFTLRIKTGIGKFKSILTLLMGLCLIVSIVYFLYYGLIAGTADEVVYDYTKRFFEPLAAYIHPEETTVAMYKKTAQSLLSYLIPLTILYIVAETVQHALLSFYEKIKNIKNKNIKKKEQSEYVQQFEKIKYYSIAISFDYVKNNAPVPIKAINQLNKVVYDRLSGSIVNSKIKIETSGIYAITSSDFYKYDSIYENLLKAIAKIKNLINEKYNIEMIPTITTDGYMEFPSTNKIIGTHYAIKGCNLKNKAINTNVFVKKYRYLGLEKFAGVSIGVYNNNQTLMVGYDEMYDLNIVIKNLTEKLERI